MAWNEPGGGSDKDPWGNRGDQGPPDLDEAFRKLQSQLSGIFGRGSGGGSGSGGVNTRFFAIGAVVAAVVYVIAGFYVVDQQERGVVFRFGAVLDQVVQPGLHWNAPIVDRVELVNVTRVNSHQHQALMLTEDENIVDVSLTVQYVIDDPVAYLINVKAPDSSLAQATESALRHVVGSSEMDAVITDGREQIAVEVQDRLQTYVDIYGTGILVSKVNIDESAPPQQVKDAFNDVQKAKEDENRYRNEANAYAESIVPEARGRARQQIEAATAYRDQVIAQAEGEADRFIKLLAEYRLAQDVTRDRLYIDAMQNVLSRSSKVIVDVDGGNNLLYLPLDRIAQGGGSTVTGSSQGQVVSDLADAVLREINNRAAQSRPRDTR